MSGSPPTRTASRPVAAFDFDGTLLDGDCLLILHSLVRSPIGRLMDGLSLLPALLVLAGGFALRWVMVGAGQASHMVSAAAAITP